jgi:hypothetical protein
LIHPVEHLFLLAVTNVFRMQKVAVASTVTVPLLVLAALGLSKVSDWHELSRDFAIFVEEALHLIHAGLRLVLVGELDPHVSYHVVANIVRDDKVLNLTVLSELHEDFLIKVFKVVDGVNQLLIRHVDPVGFHHGRIRVLVQVLKNNRLAQYWLIVQACACLSVAA